MSNQNQGIYKLSSGREVCLVNLNLTLIYTEETINIKSVISSFTRHSMVEKFEERNEPFVMLDSETDILPKFQWLAEFTSKKAINSTDDKFSSHLHICWFSDKIERDFSKVLENVLEQVNWEMMAANYETANF